MKENIYIKKIRSETQQNKPYDEYKHLFFEYIDYLKGVLADDPRDVFAVCQLAIAYLEAGKPEEKSIELMKTVLDDFNEELTAEEKHMLLTNIAFFYDDWQEEERAKLFLEEAVKIPSEYPHTYNALGRININEGKTKEALGLFSKAMKLDDHIDYQYNYAVALYCNGQTEEALKIFSRISKTWRDNETAEKAYYAYGVIKSLVGDFESGIKVADEMRLSIVSLQPLLPTDSPDIYGADLSDIYYVCGQYQRCVEMFELDNMYPMVALYNRYFYSYNAINKKEQVLALCDKVIKEKDEAIEDTIKEEVDEAWTQEDKELLIQSYKEEKRDLLDLFDRVMNKGYKPEIDFKPALVYDCYLIGCPRHWNFDTGDKRSV